MPILRTSQASALASPSDEPKRLEDFPGYLARFMHLADQQRKESWSRYCTHFRGELLRPDSALMEAWATTSSFATWTSDHLDRHVIRWYLSVVFSSQLSSPAASSPSMISLLRSSPFGLTTPEDLILYFGVGLLSHTSVHQKLRALCRKHPDITIINFYPVLLSKYRERITQARPGQHPPSTVFASSRAREALKPADYVAAIQEFRDRDEVSSAAASEPPDEESPASQASETRGNAENRIHDAMIEPESEPQHRDDVQEAQVQVAEDEEETQMRDYEVEEDQDGGEEDQHGEGHHAQAQPQADQEIAVESTYDGDAANSPQGRSPERARSANMRQTLQKGSSTGMIKDHEAQDAVDEGNTQDVNVTNDLDDGGTIEEDSAAMDIGESPCLGGIFHDQDPNGSPTSPTSPTLPTTQASGWRSPTISTKAIVKAKGQQRSRMQPMLPSIADVPVNEPKQSISPKEMLGRDDIRRNMHGKEQSQSKVTLEGDCKDTGNSNIVEQGQDMEQDVQMKSVPASPVVPSSSEPPRATTPLQRPPRLPGTKCLDEGDLATLEDPGLWVNDEIINWFFAWIATHDLTWRSLTSLSLTTAQAIRIEHYGLGGGAECGPSLSFTSPATVVTGLNLDNNHWVALSYNLVRNEIQVLDSSRSPSKLMLSPDTWPRYHIERFIQLAGPAAAVTVAPTTPNTNILNTAAATNAKDRISNEVTAYPNLTVNYRPVPLQIDSDSCGVHSILNVMSGLLVNTAELSTLQPSATLTTLWRRTLALIARQVHRFSNFNRVAEMPWGEARVTEAKQGHGENGSRSPSTRNARVTSILTDTDRSTKLTPRHVQAEEVEQDSTANDDVLNYIQQLHDRFQQARRAAMDELQTKDKQTADLEAALRHHILPVLDALFKKCQETHAKTAALVCSLRASHACHEKTLAEMAACAHPPPDVVLDGLQAFIKILSKQITFWDARQYVVNASLEAEGDVIIVLEDDLKQLEHVRGNLGNQIKSLQSMSV